jgi:regulator of CtrA degradation
MNKPLTFLNQTLSSAQDLLHLTHEYIKWQAPIDVEDLGPHETFRISCEAMRVTIRLTQIITWLTLQKAILSGDVTREEILTEGYQVLRGQTCIESDSEEDIAIPPRLRELLKESRLLYERILRLDDVFRQEHLQPEDIKKDPLKG